VAEQSKNQITNKEDIALVERALDDDRNAQRLLVERYQGPIYAYLYRWLRNRADAEDLTQDVFVKMFRSLHTYSRQSSFRAWLYRIARNRFIDYLRRKKPQASDIEDMVLVDERSKTPVEAYHEISESERLEDAIAALPLIYREVLILRHRDELSYEEIVEATDLALGTVKARLHRARSLLKKHLTEVKLL
jgi:RNA polymerase sigma factor (sigma-70 family)